MRTPISSWVLSSIVATATLVATVNVAFAQNAKSVCANAAEDAQLLRQQGKLRAAREKVLVCARPTCPDVVRDDCQKWLNEIDAALPTIVVRARDVRGNDVIGVRVMLDGKPLVETLDGKAIPIDPGPHHFRYEAAGAEPVDVDVLVAQGERNRIVLGTFSQKLTGNGAREDEPASRPLEILTANPAIERAASPSAMPPPAPTPTAASHSRSIGPFVVGGVGLLALGIFGSLDASAWSDVRSMRDGCGRDHSCSQSAVDAVDTRITLAKISLVVGAVALAAGITWFVVDSSPKIKPAARVRLVPDTRAGALDAAGTF